MRRWVVFYKWHEYPNRIPDDTFSSMQLIRLLIFIDWEDRNINSEAAVEKNSPNEASSAKGLGKTALGPSKVVSG